MNKTQLFKTGPNARLRRHAPQRVAGVLAAGFATPGAARAAAGSAGMDRA
jgi:hypothetical protein